jgi:hypothetical protein
MEIPRLKLTLPHATRVFGVNTYESQGVRLQLTYSAFFRREHTPIVAALQPPRDTAHQILAIGHRRVCQRLILHAATEEVAVLYPATILISACLSATASIAGAIEE